MLNKLSTMLKILVCILVIVGCNKNDAQVDISSNFVMEESEVENGAACDYSSYSGNWTSNGELMGTIYVHTGGALLTMNVDEDYVNGTYVYVQEKSLRIASIDIIDGKIEDSEVEISFEDDGWGNSGKLKITFKRDKVFVNILELNTNPENQSGMTITGSTLVREKKEVNDEERAQVIDIEQQIINTESYRKKSKYWVDVVRWDESNGMTGIDRPIMPLLETDAVLYKMEELEKLPHVIIYLAKNEIYARHGYIFSDPDLQNYFMGQIWYTPQSERGEFDDSVFNEYEKKNLSLMLEILE